MTTSTSNSCRFCCGVSKANGEDPIGSAGTCDRLIVVELEQPWPENIGNKHPIVQPILKAIEETSQKQGIRIRPLLIAPDREFSHPNATHVLLYHRPTSPFARFHRQEFLVPRNLIVSLVQTFLQQPDRLHEFERYRQPSDGIRDLLVCTHGNVDVACARFGYPIYERLRREFVPANRGNLRVWRCSHFSGHRFAPTLIDLPEGRFWGHLEPEILDVLVHRNGDVAGLRPYYRGWAGLNTFEQIAEREIWIREGWQWLDCRQQGQVLAIDEENESGEEDWARVRIDFTSAEGFVSGTYEATIECSGSVTTMGESGDEASIHSIKQYKVTHLDKITK